MALKEELENQGVRLFRYRGIIPLILLIVGLGLYLRTEIYPSAFFLEDSPKEVYFEIFCALVSLFGLSIRVHTVGHTPKNTSGRNTKDQKAETINKTGLYATMRHPLYFGNYFMWLGPAILTAHFWFVVAFSLFFWIYYERIMFAEEAFMREKFGDDYLDWAEKVPAFFPAFKNYKRPDTPFSWKKVLNREKNGLLAIFLVFSGLNIIGEVFDPNPLFNYFFFSGLLASFLLYAYLKVTKMMRKANLISG